MIRFCMLIFAVHKILGNLARIVHIYINFQKYRCQTSRFIDFETAAN